MTKKILIFLICLMIIPVTVNATGGVLRKNSLKTCSNGITYGMHGNGNSGTHWHEAVTNGDNYYSKGNAIYSDPCPNSTKNEGTAGETRGNTNNNTGNSNSNSGSNSSTNTSTKNKPNTTTTVITKSKDVTIKSITIDSSDITVKDEMTYETKKKNVEIKIELNDTKAKYEFNNKALNNGDNKFEIKVTAEDESVKTYILNITKNKGIGTATIKNFTFGAGEVGFDKENKANINKLENESSLDYSYELSDSSATLKVYLNDNEVEKLDNLKENDKIKLIVIDENGNEVEYEITVTNANIIYTFIVYGLSALIMSSPIIIIVIVILIKKKSN